MVPKQSKLNPCLHASALVCILVLFTTLLYKPAFAQSHNWGYKSQERSQRSSSAGITFLTKGAVDQAISSLLEATTSDPNDPLPYALLGLALDMKGRFGEAIDALHKSYRLNPKLTETILSIAITHYLTHNYDKSINALNAALKLNPNLCHLYADMGYAYLRKANLAGASDCFRRLINCYPNSQVAYQGLATAKYLMGDFAGAKQAAEQAQTILPYPPTVLLLAKLDVLTGDRSRAQKRIQEYVKTTSKPWAQRPMTYIGYSSQHDFRFDPFLADNYDNALLLKARTLDLPRESSRQRSLAKAGKVEQLRETAKTANNTAPNDFYIKHELGLLNLAAGNYSDAAAEFSFVLKLCPDCHVDLLHLGRALALDGKSAEASHFVRQYQKKYPSQPLAPALKEIARVDPGLAEIDTAGKPPEAPEETSDDSSMPQTGF